MTPSRLTFPKFILQAALPIATAISVSAQPVSITHSNNPNTIAYKNSIACLTDPPGPTRTRENSYYRSFDLNFFGITEALEVTSVDVGIEEAAHPAGVQNFHVNLYVDTNGGTPRLAELQQIGGTTIQQPYTFLKIVNVPLTGTVPAGGTLVVEVKSEDHFAQSSRAVFFMGSNSLGQTGQSYIRAPVCGAPEITTFAAIGFPNVHIVMTVHGQTGSAQPGDLNCDGEVNFDDIDPFVLALGGKAGYLAVWPNCNWLNADCNGDGKVDFNDIDPFVALLGG